MIGNNKDFTSNLNLSQYYEALGKLNEISSYNSANDEGIYHYTSTKVLNAILSTGCFRASNLFYLNDKIEYTTGIKILQQVFERDSLLTGYLSEIESFDGKSWPGIYSISYSNKADVLQQWITYAKESGVCIELNSEIMGNSQSNDFYLGIKVGENSYVRFKSGCLLKLSYEKNIALSSKDDPQLDCDQIRKVFAEAIQQSNGESQTLNEEIIQKSWEKNKDKAKHFLQLLASYYKEERFQGEGEIRAAFLPVYIGNKRKATIHYFEEKNGILRPYMNIYFFHNYHEPNNIQIECPIKSILVGPSGDQTSVYNSIVHRLKYGKIKVWQYNKEQLGQLLSEFIRGCFDQNKTLLKNGDYQDVAAYIARKWCDGTLFKCDVKMATKVEVKVALKDVGEEESGNEITSESEIVDKEVRKIVSQYLEDNYLSQDGIWVKKSTLSYIF